MNRTIETPTLADIPTLIAPLLASLAKEQTWFADTIAAKGGAPVVLRALRQFGKLLVDDGMLDGVQTYRDGAAYPALFFLVTPPEGALRIQVDNFLGSHDPRVTVLVERADVRNDEVEFDFLATNLIGALPELCEFIVEQIAAINADMQFITEDRIRDDMDRPLV